MFAMGHLIPKTDFFFVKAKDKSMEKPLVLVII